MQPASGRPTYMDDELPASSGHVGLEFDAEAAGDALIEAAADGDVEEVRLILEAASGLAELRALISHHNGVERWTSLHFAANNGHASAAVVILDHAARLFKAEQESGLRSGNKLAGTGSQQRSVQFAFQTSGLVATTPPSWLEFIAPRSHAGETPLHRCSLFGHEDVAAHILSMAGPEYAIEVLGIANRRGETPLHCAGFANSQALMDVLCSAVDAKSLVRLMDSRAEDGGAPLHFAAAEGSSNVVLSLLRAGADPEAVDYKGRNMWDVLHADLQSLDLSTVLGDPRSAACDEEKTGSSDCAEKALSSARRLVSLAGRRWSDGDKIGAMKAYSQALDLLEIKGTEDNESENPQEGFRAAPRVCLKSDAERLIERYQDYACAEDGETRQLAQAGFAGLSRCHLARGEENQCLAASERALRLDPDCLNREYCAIAHVCRASARLWVSGSDDVEAAERDVKSAKEMGIPFGDVWLRQEVAATTARLKECKAAEAEMARRMFGDAKGTHTHAVPIPHHTAPLGIQDQPAAVSGNGCP